LAERAYPEDPAYINRTKYYYALIERYEYGKKYTKEKIVLDVPCGCGWGTSFIDNAKEIFGLDISWDAINYAKSNFKGKFFQGSMCKMPFENNIFDIALCFEGIEHVTKEEGVLFINEIKRVVKKDGLIIGSVPILDENDKDTGNPFHLFEYPEKYLKLLLENNFEIIEYLLKKGGDGPIIYFILKNQYKDRITMLSSPYNKAELKLMINNHLINTSPESRLIVINVDGNDEFLDILQRNNDSRIKILSYDFSGRINIKPRCGLKMKGKPRKLTEIIRDLLK